MKFLQAEMKDPFLKMYYFLCAGHYELIILVYGNFLICSFIMWLNHL